MTNARQPQQIEEPLLEDGHPRSAHHGKKFLTVFALLIGSAAVLNLMSYSCAEGSLAYLFKKPSVAVGRIPLSSVEPSNLMAEESGVEAEFLDEGKGQSKGKGKSKGGGKGKGKGKAKGKGKGKGKEGEAAAPLKPNHNYPIIDYDSETGFKMVLTIEEEEAILDECDRRVAEFIKEGQEMREKMRQLNKLRAECLVEQGELHKQKMKEDWAAKQRIRETESKKLSTADYEESLTPLTITKEKYPYISDIGSGANAMSGRKYNPAAR